MRKIRHNIDRIKRFVRRHSTAVAASVLVLAAVGAGALQVSLSAMGDPNAGNGNKVGDVTYPRSKTGSPDFALGPEIAVTPRIYDYSSLVENTPEGDKNAILTYSKKEREVARKQGDEQKNGGGWDVHENPDPNASDTKNNIITLANAQRRDMLSATISNRAENYTDGSLVFIPSVTMKGEGSWGDVHGYTHIMEGSGISDDVDTASDHKKTSLIFMDTDDGIKSFLNGVDTKGSVSSQRAENKKALKKLLGNEMGIFRDLILEQEKKNQAQGNSKSTIKYVGADGKTYTYENQMSNMFYIGKHVDALLKSVRNAGRSEEAEKMFALSTNVFKSGGTLYTQPDSLQDYVNLVTYNTVTKDEDKKKNIEQIMGGSTKGARTGTEHVVKGTTELDVYKEFVKDQDISSQLFSNKTSKSGSLAAQYMQGEYNMAYLDMLLCGYSIACKKSGKDSGPAKAWKKAVTTYIEAVNNKAYNATIVTVRLDVGLASKAVKGGKPTFYHTSAGTMMKRVFDLGDAANIDEANADVNKKTMVKSFIGIQTMGAKETAKDIRKKKLVFNGNDYIETYKKARTIGAYYKRIGLASKEARKSGKIVEDYSQYGSGIVNRLFNIKAIGAAGYDSTAPNAAGSEDFIELLKNGLTASDKKAGVVTSAPYYNYGTYATVSMSWWDSGIVPEDPSEYELRVYSTKAHAFIDGSALSDNKEPDTGKAARKDGYEVHDTAELAEITVTKPGEHKLTDQIHLKVDTANLDNNFSKILEKGDAKIRVTYYADSTGDGSPETDAEQRAQGSPAILSNGKMDGNKQTRYQDKDASKATADPDKYTFQPIEIDMGSADATGVSVTEGKERYYDNGQAVAPDKERIKETSSYYGHKSEPEWDACTIKNINYMNLVWQTTFNEMESKGFTYEVPKDDKKWEHYYRVCVVAKVEIMDTKGGYYFKDDKGKADKGKSVKYTNPVYVTYKVTYKPGDPKFEFYANSGNIDNSESVKAHAYSEFKEGSIYNETFEAMAGVPSTRTMYFATGGEEFMVNLQAVYDDYVAKKGNTVGENGENVDPNAYKAIRKYTVHFNGVDCEYKAGDTMKALGPGQTKTEEFVATSSDEKNKHSVLCEGNNATELPAHASGNVNVTEHSGDYFSASWSGTIRNNNSDGWDGSGNVSPSGQPCEGGDPGSVVTSYSTPGQGPNWDASDFNRDLDEAAQWLDQMLATNNRDDGTVWRIDDSDGHRRVYKIGKANVTISVNGTFGDTGTAGYEQSFNTQSTSNGNGGWISGHHHGGSDSVWGTGAGWTMGEKAHAEGSHKENKDKKGNITSITHSSWAGYRASTHGYISSLSYSITISFHDGTIKSDTKGDDPASAEVVTGGTKTGLTGMAAHSMCGACCQHVLPAIEDTWTQKVRYDTVRFSALQVWKLDDGYAGDTEGSSGEMATLKRKTDGNGSGGLCEVDLAQPF